MRYEYFDQGHHDLKRITALYESAFPANERGPLSTFLHGHSRLTDALAFYDDRLFCGLACTIDDRDITHLLYLAIPRPLRGRGYGTMALDIVHDLKPGRRIIVDIEKPTDDIRRRRQSFYLDRGYKPTAIRYHWRGEDYEIMARGGTVTTAEFWAFWDDVMAQDASFADH